ncbi:hypothetical protein GCM10010123_46550 [Pilimelia anulata]|uniref:Uncharacterized protein n=1 Tax=Pilimelia anulata TaxID=53371 RepID=A0A8J3BKX4_9ACTN|nr:hypothetical protein GCM10010123_46550 [Pilimelia anulata]
MKKSGDLCYILWDMSMMLVMTRCPSFFCRESPQLQFLLR